MRPSELIRMQFIFSFYSIQHPQYSFRVTAGISFLF